jgi:hypothetical protein
VPPIASAEAAAMRLRPAVVTGAEPAVIGTSAILERLALARCAAPRASAAAWPFALRFPPLRRAPPADLGACAPCFGLCSLKLLKLRQPFLVRQMEFAANVDVFAVLF